MYEAALAHPDGDSTAARLALRAATDGYDGLVVRTTDGLPSVDPARLRDRFDVDVVAGVEVDADDPEGASGAVGNFRPKTPLLAVRGGTDALNRFAVEQDRVDVLARPTAGESEVNHVLARAAADHGVRVEVDLGPVLRRSGGRRVNAIRGLRTLQTLLRKYDAPHVVSARPASHLQLRAPRELLAVGERVGLDREFVREGLAEWGRLVARNRERASDSFIAPGVERGRHEADDR